MEKYSFDTLDGLKASEKKACEESLCELLFDVYKELSEVVDAASDYKRKPIRSNRMHIVYELADVQFTCETMMQSLGFGKPERDSIRDDVASGNQIAGYYDSNKKMYSLFCLHEKSNLVEWKGTYKRYGDALEAVKAFVEDDKQKGFDGRSYYLGEFCEFHKLYDAECGF